MSIAWVIGLQNSSHDSRAQLIGVRFSVATNVASKGTLEASVLATNLGTAEGRILVGLQSLHIDDQTGNASSLAGSSRAEAPGVDDFRYEPLSCGIMRHPRMT